jgi:hypothetical protein
LRTEKKTSKKKIIIINSIRNSKQVSGGSCPVSRLRKKGGFFFVWGGIEEFYRGGKQIKNDFGLFGLCAENTKNM